MQDRKDDDLVIDFSKITGIFKKGKKKDKKKEDDSTLHGSHVVHATHQSHEAHIENEETGSVDSKKSSDDEKIDFKEAVKTMRKYAVPILILIPIILSILFRIQPFYLPITDDWAEQTIMNSYRAGIAGEVDAKYPHLPETDRARVVEEQLAAMLENDDGRLQESIGGLSNSYKARMQDESGQTYLLAIDPYLWYGESKNYVENGQFGNEINEDGDDWYSLRNGRIGVEAGTPVNSIVTVMVYKFISIFNKDYSVMSAAFLVPLIIMTLAVIPIFFLGRKFAGNIGGFFAATIFAIHPALLNRTVAGFSDTDPYTIFFPLLTFWLFFEGLDSKSAMRKRILFILSGISLALFNVSWGQGWWYTFDFILGAAGLYLVYYVATNFKKVKNDFSGFAKGKQVKDFFATVIILSLSFAVFRGFLSFFFDRNVNVFIGFKHVIDAMFSQPMWFINIKDVAVTTIWPNVLTTVAELNASSWEQIISSLGGGLLFSVSILGIILVLMQARDSSRSFVQFALLLTIWYLASIFAALTSLRFIAIIVPVFALAFGSGVGILYGQVSKWLGSTLNVSDYVTKPAIIVAFLLLLIMPVNAAWQTSINELPSYTDAWEESLTVIKERSDDAIITSWWDFGHWFVARGERRVTFDGGDQGNRIHWAGKALLTSNEDEAVAILRMLNCGQESAYDRLENITGDAYGSKLLLDDIILMDRDDAISAFEEAGLSDDEVEELIEYTHCDDLIDQYYIASEDMVGKAGVWGHFGGWDFDRAYIHNQVKKLSATKGIQKLVDDFGYTEKEAEKEYYDIKSKTADEWVTGWPSFFTGEEQCEKQADTVICPTNFCLESNAGQCSHWVFAVGVNMTTMETQLVTNKNIALTPREIVYSGKDDIETIEFEDSHLAASFGLIKRGESYSGLLMHPDLAHSMFTRVFFFDGLGLRYFREVSDRMTFRGLRIRVYSVEFEAMDPYVPNFGSPIILDMIDSEDSEVDDSDADDEVSNVS